ncbi:MAG: T9SS type A sorting domain-containing protein [Ignavibacterium sp.]|nr:T9SS type A sorting domain-containing protein [Ignavibacterium sp.]
MKIKIILIVLLISTIIFAQNTYEVKPGVKNNAIVLELSNVSTTESANNLEVKLIRSSQNLIFNQKEKMIENITQGTEKEATFTFDVEYNIGKAAADTIEFMITNNQSVYLIKKFILQYSLPTEYKLEQNYPNPFNPTTKIRYSIPNLGPDLQNVNLTVYDILGNQIKTLVDEPKETGYHEIDFNASVLASGVYVYRLTAGNFVSVKKMMVLK